MSPQNYTDDCFAANHAVQTDQQNVENNFACLKSSFSGAAAPADLVAGMWWFDTTANILKHRNEVNNAWLSVWDLANNKPVIANLSDEITHGMVAAANKDGVAGAPSMRTLGTGAQQAMKGSTDLNSKAHTGDVTGTTALTIGAAKINRSKLKTSMSSVNVTGTTWAKLTLPGGEYGFYPQVKGSDTSASYEIDAVISKSNATGETLTYLTRISLKNENAGGTTYAQQRYITSSGEVFWIFILREKVTKKIVSMSQSPDHPCFGNGGKPFMVPHPFGSHDPEIHEIIVINPSEDEVAEMKDKTLRGEDEPDKDLLEVIVEEYEIDEASNPKWPGKEVTVSLPTDRDWKRDPDGTPVVPIKKKIPKPGYIITRSLKAKVR